MSTRYTGKDGWANAVGHEVGPGVTIKTEPGILTVKLPCTICHETKDYIIPRRYPPVVIRKKLEEFGWRTGRHLSCPGCVKTRPSAHKKIIYDSPETTVSTGAAQVSNGKSHVPPVTTPTVAADKRQSEKMPPCEPSQEALAKVNSLSELGKLVPQGWMQNYKPSHSECPVPVETKPARKVLTQKPPAAAKAPPPAPEPAAPPQPLVEQQPTPAAQQAHRRMMALLEEVLDDDRGVYRNGKDGKPYSDERVAKEAGVSLEHVRHNRDKWFCPLQQPEAVKNLSQKVLALETHIAEFEASARATVDQLRAELASVRGELESVNKLHGWS